MKEGYCEAKGKVEDELDDNDMQCIIDRVTTVVNEELANTLMQGQQFSAINDIAHENLAHEDFGDKHNFDYINFREQWTRCDTLVQEMLSLDTELEKEAENPDAPSTIEPGHEVDYIGQVLINSFCETLNDVDVTIFHMRMEGRTHAQIAEKVGYKNHSAVLKRVRKIAERWTEYMNEIKPK